WGLGRVVLSGQRHLALVRPQGRILAVHLLHYPAQLRSSAALEAELPQGAVSAEEQKLAAVLIDNSCRQPLRWADYRDDTAEQLKAWIEARLQGKPLEVPTVKETTVRHLLDALKQSVAQALDEQPSAKPAASAPRPPRKRSRRSA